MKKTIFSTIISIFLLILFTYAATTKLSGFSTFHTQLLQSPFVTRYADAVAYGLPIFELLLAFFLLAGLLYPRLQYYGLLASVFIMAMFTSYIFMMLNFSFYIPCSCGGILSHMSWGQHLVFNVVVTALAIAAALLEQLPVKAPAK